MDTKEEISTLKETVQLIKNYVELPEMILLKEKNVTKYKEFLFGVFPVFAETYPVLFDMIISGRNTNFLDSMLESLIKIACDGANPKEVEKSLGEDMAEKFLYPQLPEHIKKKMRKE